MADQHSDLIDIMNQRIEAHKARGDWEGAGNTATTIVETYLERYQSDASNIGHYARTLEIKADFYRDAGKQFDAQKTYKTIIDLLAENPNHPDICGRVGANIALLCEGDELFDDAIKFYLWALENLELADPKMPLEIAGVTNNLAYLYENTQNMDEAEKLFLKALNINTEVLGHEHESTADVWNNLGGLYYRSGNYAQAYEMHKTALEIRLQVLGEDHFDTAQSYGNIALVHAAQDEIEKAKDEFNSALTIMEKLKNADLHHYAIISSNFTHILKEIGHPKDAEKIKKRTSKFLRKH